MYIYICEKLWKKYDCKGFTKPLIVICFHSLPFCILLLPPLTILSCFPLHHLSLLLCSLSTPTIGPFSFSLFLWLLQNIHSYLKSFHRLTHSEKAKRLWNSTTYKWVCLSFLKTLHRMIFLKIIPDDRTVDQFRQFIFVKKQWSTGYKQIFLKHLKYSFYILYIIILKMFCKTCFKYLKFFIVASNGKLSWCDFENRRMNRD